MVGLGLLLLLFFFRIVVSVCQLCKMYGLSSAWLGRVFLWVYFCFFWLDDSLKKKQKKKTKFKKAILGFYVKKNVLWSANQVNARTVYTGKVHKQKQKAIDNQDEDVPILF